MKSNSDSPAQRVAARWKFWALRLLVITASPLLAFGLLESGLRLLGYGYPTSFLLKESENGKPVLVQNTKFGWTFFGRGMARVPAPICIPKNKPAGTVRIFVFGESAAYGDPQPEFGLPRMLEALLSLRHPEMRFEVVNAAMTAINSHAMLRIAKDCAKADGDIWVVYAGNNEVVGPFGAGTVFGTQVPPLALVRASLALKTTRTGQLLDASLEKLHRNSAEASEWGGMAMFLSQQLRADDPRMERVHHHFERNLGDVLEIGRRAGVGIVVSTVPVNLCDCPPLGSTNRLGLSRGSKIIWDEAFRAGVAAQIAASNEQAAVCFRRAAAIDDSAAELRFRLAECALQLGQVDDAQEQFRAARELDTLRFRCDSRLTELTRRLAAGREGSRILLADAERVFAAHSSAGAPGSDLFYEHVHLTFEGNYLLARTVAAEIEKLLPATGNGEGAVPSEQRATTENWPSSADCARRLAWSPWSEQAAWAEIQARLQRPPFTAQCNHASQLSAIALRLQKLSPANHTDSINETLKLTAAAVAAVPDDHCLQEQLATLRKEAGDLSGAAQAAKRAVELLPTSSEYWLQLGLIMGQQHQYEEACLAFKQAYELDPQEVASLENLGHALEQLGRPEEARRAYRRAVEARPRFGPAWLDLAQSLQKAGREQEAADCLRKAFANRVPREAELLALARFCQGHGWREAAATNYQDAIRLSPYDAGARVEAGKNLVALGRRAEALPLFADAVKLGPDAGMARFEYGLALGREGRATEAAEQFSEAARLMPEMLEARLNLGFALMNANRPVEASAQFDWVLQRSPTNQPALRGSNALRSKLAEASSH